MTMMKLGAFILLLIMEIAECKNPFFENDKKCHFLEYFGRKIYNDDYEEYNSTHNIQNLTENGIMDFLNDLEDEEGEFLKKLKTIEILKKQITEIPKDIFSLQKIILQQIESENRLKGMCMPLKFEIARKDQTDEIKGTKRSLLTFFTGLSILILLHLIFNVWLNPSDAFYLPILGLIGLISTSIFLVLHFSIISFTIIYLYFKIKDLQIFKYLQSRKLENEIKLIVRKGNGIELAVWPKLERLAFSFLEENHKKIIYSEGKTRLNNQKNRFDFSDSVISTESFGESSVSIKSESN